MSDTNKSGGGAMDSLKIPLNLKNAYRPFVLDPSNELVKIQENAASAKGKPQVFSFKYGDGKSTVGILPNSWGGCPDSALRKDISMQLLYPMTPSGDVVPMVVSTSQLLEHIPMVQIREYQQDSKLNQVFSLLGSIKEGFDKGMDAATSGSGIGDALSSLKSNATKYWKIFKWIVVNPDEFVKKLLGGIPLSRDMKCTGHDAKTLLSIINVPHILYYQMISSLSINIFELPFSGELARESNGHGGWNSARGLKGIGTSGGGFFQKFIGYFGDNIKVNMTPTWDGAPDEEGTTIEFSVNLFNDSVETTCINFILVNTLISAGMYTQYHIFQQSPSLFDIKVDGLGRFFMCSGSFKVEYKGVVRTPSKQIIDTLATKYKNPIYNFDAAYLRESGIVKIPDVYHITLQFKSLLPNSFNNYIYSHCANAKITNKQPIYSESVYGPLWDSFKKTVDEIGAMVEKEESQKKMMETSKKLVEKDDVQVEVDI